MAAHKRINKNFFKKWSKEMAYVVGFFAADGYMTVNKRGGQYWSMDIGDRKFIDQIKKVIHSEHKISVRKRNGGQYTTYRLQIGSIEMCDDLRKLGFKERKTHSLSIPKVPNEYFSDFVRGYFDGDGNVWSGLMRKGKNTSTLSIQTVFTSCSLKFLEEMMRQLEVFGVIRGVLTKGRSNYYRLTYSVKNSLKLYDFMYNGLDASTLFLKRKRDVFEEYIKMRL